MADNSDVVSRIASDMAKKAACDAHREGCENCPNEALIGKQELAEKSIEAAGLAQSSLADKRKLVNKLSEEKKTVECVLQELFVSKRQLEAAIDKEMEAFAAAATLKDMLDKALSLATKIAVNADSVLSGLTNNIEATNDILQSENKQWHILNRKEQRAKAEVEATRVSEKKALESAIQARKNANENNRQEFFNRELDFR